ncbi:MAG: response regulator, partial [Campylobacteraceae bacterium]|nr:response regulator [Campylobacteraceae bacterium]
MYRDFLSESSLLYVEDNKFTRDVFTKVLKSRVKNLYIAKDGMEGLEQFKKNKPNVILTDVEMPKMDGIQMAKKIKILNKNIPVIITSAHSDVEFLMQSIEVGINGYLLKPVDKTKLIDVLEENIKTNFLARELFEHQSKLALMGGMIENIAHQWKQPLNALLSQIQLIEFDFDEKLVNKEYIKKLSSTTKSLVNFMSKTIDDFQNFFNSKKMKKNFHILECIEMPLNILEPQLKIANIKFNVKGDDFVIYGLENEFKQVVLNIINNAKEALIEKKIKNGKIEIELKVVDSQGIITITDNAGGMPYNVITKIFDPYYSTKEKSKGTGIGLYMSKMIIVDDMKG